MKLQARELLNMPAVINMEIVCAQIELKHYKELAEKMKACFCEADECNSKLSEVNKKISECKKFLSEKYLSRIEAEGKILKSINKLKDERIKTALKYRYICLMKYEEIGDKMSYCTRQVRRFCEKGMEELDGFEEKAV